MSSPTRIDHGVNTPSRRRTIRSREGIRNQVEPSSVCRIRAPLIARESSVVQVWPVGIVFGGEVGVGVGLTGGVAVGVGVELTVGVGVGLGV